MAHRNLVSIFDLSEEQWTHSLFDDTVRYMGLVTRNNKKSEGYKRGEKVFNYTEKYKIAVVVGWQQIYFFRVQDDKMERETGRVFKTDGLIRRCMKDEVAYNGIFMLITDTQGGKCVHIEHEGN